MAWYSSTALRPLLLASAAVQVEWVMRDSAMPCILETGAFTLHNGYQDTRVRLNLNAERLLVMTGSNVDTGFGDIAL